MNQRTFDTIVAGSGISGLAAAAALAKCGRRVLVLEQHFQLGGSTQVFRRNKYKFATGMHYLGGLGDSRGPENQFGRILQWLTDGRLRFTSSGSPYDIVRLPGFEFPVEAPRTAYIERLKAAFPGETASIDRYFAASNEAEKATKALFAARALPAPIAGVLRWIRAPHIKRALGTTVAGAVRDIRDPRLAALLSARWGDHGIPPAQSPFAVHALVMGSYFSGSYYPVGGPARFAEAFGETVRAAGGELRARAAIAEIRVAGNRVSGVRLANGESIDAPIVVSTMGARNTVAALSDGVATDWRRDIESLKSSSTYVSLYLGLHGDIRKLDVTPANVWVYESNDVGRLWERPEEEEAPGLFVSFPSLKDAGHDDPEHHTAEVVVMCRWEPFAAWAASAPRRRPAEYEAMKARIGEKLLAQFKRHFPQLAPLIDFQELSTPLSQAYHLRADRGAAYGLEMSAERLTHRALNVRTPVKGLLLGGQDVTSLGIEGAFIGGFMAAASIEPRLWRRMMR
jgi:all-trans-retinol 13,14-reductase